MGRLAGNIVLAALVMCVWPLGAAPPEKIAGVAPAETQFIARYCGDCHGQNEPEAKLTLTGLSGDLARPHVLPLWQAVHEKLAGREMPPAEAPQPPEGEREAVLQRLAAALQAAGVVLDEGKWLAPIKGNHVDHRALFARLGTQPESGAASAPAGGNPRLWRLTGQAYEEYFDRLLKHFRLGLKNYGEHKLTAPWNFTPQRDFVDYAAAHRVGEAELEFLLRNAAIVAPAMVKRHAGSTPSAGGYIKELATLIKAGDKATPAQAEAALTPTFQALFQRPPTAGETERYGAFLRKSVPALGGPAAAEQLLTALFCNTELIHRIELPAGPTHRLPPRDLARAVAFALTDSMPDETLLQAAAGGKLTTREEVAAQVQRLLADPATPKPRVLRFFREYFGYASAPHVFKDEATLKTIGIRSARGWNAEFFVSDADRIVQAVLEEDRDVLEQLLTTTKTFAMTVPLAEQNHTKTDAYRLKKTTLEADEQTVIKVYEIAIAARADWSPDRQYDFPAGRRLGLLTHPAWLVAHSSNFDNHAIHRGRWIRERLLGGRIPELPITVNAMLPDEPHRTLRDRMQVTREADCWKCHQQMDPLGLPFEQYDHFGQFRMEELVVDREATAEKRNLDKNGLPKQTRYQAAPLDTRGEISGAIDPALDGPVRDPFELIRRLAASEHVEQVFVRHAFRYFLGRNETLADGPTLAAAHRAYREQHGSMRALITALLSSEPFLHRTPPAAP